MGKYTYQAGGGDPVIITTEIGTDITKTEERIAVQKSRRNARLASSDGWLVTDRGTSDSKITEWKTYRQSLRDMDFSNPDDIVFPEKAGD